MTPPSTGQRAARAPIAVHLEGLGSAGTAIARRLTPGARRGPGQECCFRFSQVVTPPCRRCTAASSVAIATLMGDDENRDNFFHNNFGTDPFWRWLSYAALYLPVKFLRDLLKIVHLDFVLTKTTVCRLREVLAKGHIDHLGRSAIYTTPRSPLHGGLLQAIAETLQCSISPPPTGHRCKILDTRIELMTRHLDAVHSTVKPQAQNSTSALPRPDGPGRGEG